METVRSVNPNTANGAVVANSPAPARAAALPPTQRVAPANAAVPSQLGPRPMGQGLANWDNQLQDDVARAQQALDYLNRLEDQLESVKADLAARLSGSRGSRQLDARISQLAATLEGRKKKAAGVDAQLGFSSRAPAAQRFRMRGIDIASLKAAGTQTLGFNIKGMQLSVPIKGGMSAGEMARQFDLSLGAVGVHAAIDDNGELLFSAQEPVWQDIRDSISLSGQGRVAIDEEPSALSPEGWETGNVDSLRRSLREVVQALVRVKRSKETAAAALSGALERAATAPPPADPKTLAQNFVDTASSPDYDSLIAITSALVGVSRERVQALLGLRS